MTKTKKKQGVDFIENFFIFLNRDIDKIDYANVATIGLEYLQFLFYSKENTEFSKYQSKYDLFTSVALGRSEPKLNEIKKHLKSVQSHLVTVLTNLVEKKPPVSIKQNGTRVISVVNDKFIENFEIKEIPLDRLDKKAEMQKAEYLVIDVIMNEGLIPSHFKRCEKCDNFLYQSTKRKQVYCSNNCGSAVRQSREYQKKKDKL